MELPDSPSAVTPTPTAIPNVIGMKIDTPSPTVSVLDAEFAELEDLLSQIRTMQTDLKTSIDKRQACRQTSIDSLEVVSSFRQSFLNPSSDDVHKAEDLDKLLLQINHHRFGGQPEQTTLSASQSLLVSTDVSVSKEFSHQISSVCENKPEDVRESQRHSKINDLSVNFETSSSTSVSPQSLSAQLSNVTAVSEQNDVTCQAAAAATTATTTATAVVVVENHSSSDNIAEIVHSKSNRQTSSVTDLSIPSTELSTVDKKSSLVGIHITSQQKRRVKSCNSCYGANNEMIRNPDGSAEFTPHHQHQHHTLTPLLINPRINIETPSIAQKNNSEIDLRRHSNSSTTSTCTTSEDLESEKYLWQITDEIKAKADRVEALLQESHLVKLIARIHRADKTTKAVLIDEKSLVGDLCKIVAEKNYELPQINHALVEKVPDMKIERVIEDHEYLLDTLRVWPQNSRNIIFFEDKPDKFGPFLRPEKYLPNASANENEFYDKFCTRIIKGVFNDENKIELPNLRDNLYIKKPGQKTWIRRLCTVNLSGIYASKKTHFATTLTEIVNITPFHYYLQLYVSTGGWCKDKKLNAPTPFGFALKPIHIQKQESKSVLYFCASDEAALRRWIAVIRIAKIGHMLYEDFKAAEDRCRDSIPNNNFINARKMSRVYQTIPRAKSCCGGLTETFSELQDRKVASLSMCLCGDASHIKDSVSDNKNNKLSSSINVHELKMRHAKHLSHARSPVLPIDTINTKHLVTSFAQQCGSEPNLT